MSDQSSNIDNTAHGQFQYQYQFPAQHLHQNIPMSPYQMPPQQSNMHQPPPPPIQPMMQNYYPENFGMYPQPFPPTMFAQPPMGQPYYPQPQYPLQPPQPPQLSFYPNPNMNGGNSGFSSVSAASSASSNVSTPNTSATTAPTTQGATSAPTVVKPKHKYTNNLGSVETFKPSNRSHEQYLEQAQKKLERSAISSPSFASPLISTQNLVPITPYSVTPPIFTQMPQQQPPLLHPSYANNTQHISNNDFNDNNDNDHTGENTSEQPIDRDSSRNPQDKKTTSYENIGLPFDVQSFGFDQLPLTYGTTFEKINEQRIYFKKLEKEQELAKLKSQEEDEKLKQQQQQVSEVEAADTTLEVKDSEDQEDTTVVEEEEETKDSLLVQKSQSSSPELPALSSPATAHAPVVSVPVAAPMAWSSMAQSAASIKPKTVTVSSSKPSASSSSASAKPQPVFVPSVSNALEPLGAVILKYVYDKSFKNKNLISQLPKVTPRGLVNTGNICFMSSILQLLLHCEPFYQSLHLIASKSIGAMNIKDSKSPLFDALVDFFKEFVQKNEGKEFGENITPSQIYSAITAHNNFQHLQWGQQEDAEEFFGYLLDGLNEEFTESVKNLSEAEIKSLLNSILNDETRNNIKASFKKFNSPELESQEDKVTTTSSTTVGEDGWQEVNNSKKIVSSSRREVEIKPSPINHLFGGQFRSTLKVPNEKHTQSITLDPFLQIQLDISDDEITSLTEAFKRISTIEELQYKANGGKDVIATKQTFIDRLPNVLIIHLKRFSFTNKTSRYGRIEKIRKVIEYKEKLSVPVECLSPAIRSTPAEYKLIGVVYHHGLNSDGGHYTVDVLRNGSGNEWIRIDDTNITNLELEHVLPNPGSEESKTAYILMYQRISA